MASVPPRTTAPVPTSGSNHVVLFRVQSPTLQTRCVEALTWLGRPGLQVGRLDRDRSHFVMITCADATARVLAEGFVLGIDPFATRVG